MMPMNRRNDRKIIFRELARKALHIIIGTAVTLLAYAGIITGAQIIAVSFVLLLLSLLQKKYEFSLAYRILQKVDRRDIIPGYGAIMLGFGLGLSFIIFPLDIALIAGISVSLVDGVSTFIASLQEKNGSRRNGYATIAGSIAAFAFLTSFFAHIAIPVIAIGILAAAAMDYWYGRIWILDDNLLIPIVSGAASYAALIIMTVA
jgi:dolichol kinase